MTARTLGSSFPKSLLSFRADLQFSRGTLRTQDPGPERSFSVCFPPRTIPSARFPALSRGNSGTQPTVQWLAMIPPPVNLRGGWIGRGPVNRNSRTTDTSLSSTTAGTSTSSRKLTAMDRSPWTTVVALTMTDSPRKRLPLWTVILAVNSEVARPSSA